MNVVNLGNHSLAEELELKEKARKLINENDSFVLVVKRPGVYIYDWISCNIKDAEMVTVGGLLLHDGASGFREIDKQG